LTTQLFFDVSHELRRGGGGKGKNVFLKLHSPFSMYVMMKLGRGVGISKNISESQLSHGEKKEGRRKGGTYTYTFSESCPSLAINTPDAK